MRQTKRILGSLLAAAILVMPFSAMAQDDAPVMGADVVETCAAPANLPETVTLGAVFTLSGGASVYGVVQQNAVNLAVEEINASGFLGEGTTLQFIFEDSASENEQAITAMTKLVEEDGVVAVLGPTLSREAFAADPIAEENGTPVMGVSNTAAGITDMGEFVFRDSLPESAVIPGVVSQATEALGLTKVGLIYANDDDFTVSGYEIFKSSFEEAGVEVVGEETYATGDVDFRTQLTNLISAEPDVIAMSALAVEGVQMILQARELGFEGTIMGGNGFNSLAVIGADGADAAADGLLVGAAWNIGSSTPLSVGFTDNYTAAYEIAPDQFGAQAYTGAWLLASAIRCADSVDKVAVRDALAALTDIETPLGTFSFDEDRNPVHPPVVQVAEGGAFSVLGAE